MYEYKVHVQALIHLCDIKLMKHLSSGLYCYIL
jgi:hypothetical protein